MSQQKVVHGGTIETVTPQELGKIIADAFGERRDTEYRRHKDTAAADGGGNCVLTVTAPRMYDWICERVTLVGTNGGAVNFFENQQAFPDLMEAVTLNANGLYSDSFSNTMLLPAGSKLLIVFSGITPAAPCSVNLQVRMVRVNY